MPLRLKFPIHCQERIADRTLQIEHIRKAINEPDLQKVTFKDRVLVRKKIDEERVIEVIYYRDGFKDTNDIIIITAIYLKP